MTAQAKFQQRSLASSIAQLASTGARRLLLTSTTAEEGKTAVAAELAREVAAGGQSVVLVGADPHGSVLHRQFGLGPGRGLGEVLAGLYGVDLAAEDPGQFGIGDWLELLRAQRRSGELLIDGGTESLAVRFQKGRVCCIAGRAAHDGFRLGELLVESGKLSPAQRDQALRVQGETAQPLGDILSTLHLVQPGELVPALRAQCQHRLQGLLRQRQVSCRFTEMVEPHRPVAFGRGWSLPESDCVDEFITAHLRSCLGDPYLSGQLPSFLRDTAQPALKLMLAGNGAEEPWSPTRAAALALLLERLGRLFDLVLVEAPALSCGPATAALATAADGVVLIVRAGWLDAAHIRRAVDGLHRAGTHVVGVVLNEGETRPPRPNQWLPAAPQPMPARPGRVIAESPR